MKPTVVIGTRGSELALWQTNFIRTQLSSAFPDSVFELKIIKTAGDAILDVALSKIGDKGLFTRQIENELLAGTIDCAVHSLKDLETDTPENLKIGAVARRASPLDALVSRKYSSLDDLPLGAAVATGSLRRRSQLLAYRGDLEIREIRGNVPTRLQKFDTSDLDGVILAAAGLVRLDLANRIKQSIPSNVMLPAAGQGVVAVEIRSNDREMAAMCKKIDHAETRACTAAERVFLKRLEGGCQVPIGALAVVENSVLKLDGMVGSLDGATIIRDAAFAPVGEAEALGERLASVLLERGAAELVAAARHGALAAAAREVM